MSIMVASMVPVCCEVEHIKDLLHSLKKKKTFGNDVSKLVVNVPCADWGVGILAQRAEMENKNTFYTACLMRLCCALPLCINITLQRDLKAASSNSNKKKRDQKAT